MNKPNYGFDAPSVMRNLLIFGLLAILIGIFIPNFSENIWLKYLSLLIILIGTILAILGTSMVIYGMKGKYRVREMMLNKIAWKGNEMVLDIGTGLLVCWRNSLKLFGNQSNQ